MTRRKRLKRLLLPLLLNYSAYVGGRLVLELFRFVPYRAAVAAGRLSGRVFFLLALRERRRALEHLTLAFPERSAIERLGLARRCFENLGKTLFVSPLFYRMDPGRMRRHIRGTDELLARLDELLLRGRGLVALSAHLGNWEVLGGLVGRCSAHALHVVGHRIAFAPFNDLLARMRRGSAMKVIPLSETSWDILRALKQNHIVALLADQDIRFLPGVFVDFFGRACYTPVGPVIIARLSGAPLVPFFLVHEGEGFRCLCGEEIELDFSGDPDESLRANTLRWSRAVEDVIRRHPDQWVWNHRRWKTRPGDPKAGKPRAAVRS